MSDGYTKLFSTITDSTIWAAPDATRLVWITMLAMADQHGYVGASVPGLASRARVDLDACIKALDTFLSPDKWSRTPDFEGRRIAEAEGGWVLLNHSKYRAARSADERREYMRKLMADKRALAKVSKVSRGEPQLAQAEAEAEAKAKIKYIPPINGELLSDWLEVRKAKRSGKLTETAFKGLQREARLAGLTDEQAVKICCERGWQSFKAEWFSKPLARTKADIHAETLAGLTGKGNNHDAIDITPTRILD